MISRQQIELAFLDAKIPLAKIRRTLNRGFYVYLLDKSRYWIWCRENLNNVIVELKKGK